MSATDAAITAHASAPPAAESVTLVVENMVCGGCMTKIERALARHPGVAAARANLSTKRVRATVDPALADAEALIEALDREGFRAAPFAPTAAIEAEAGGDLLKRIGVVGFAAANVMLMSVAVWAGLASDMGAGVQALLHWASALIALPAIAYGGVPFFRSALAALAHGRLNMDAPISLAVILAGALSLYQTMAGGAQVYFDAGVTLLFFLLIGRYLDLAMRARARGAAANLIGLRASSANVIGPDGAVSRRPASEIAIGARIAVAMGERVPLDGVVRAGASEIDEALITGETAPRAIAPGERIFAGAVNLSAPIEIEAAAQEDGSLLAQIGELMEAAEAARGRYVGLAERAARIYAPAVHGLAALGLIGWLMAGAGFEQALTVAVAVLIITCPCALALAAPAVQAAASARLFSEGLLMKSGDALERLAEIDAVALDKTGVLTLGRPRLANPDAVRDADLAAAARLAAQSRHPLSRALVEAAEARLGLVTPADGVAETPGFGLAGADGARLGSAAWCGVEADVAAGPALWFRAAERDAVRFDFADDLRADAAATVAQLRAKGLCVELLSGDRPAPVAAAARAVAIAPEDARASQAPADKIARLEALKAQGARVLMVGDGLNDAPALAAAHASISPSSAADIAQTTADIVAQGARLGGVATAISVARKARALTLQNFAIAIAYNAVFVPLALAGAATPLIAAIAMSTSSLAVTANALRLRVARLGDAR